MAIGIKTSLTSKDQLSLSSHYAHGNTWTYAGDNLSYKPYGSHDGSDKWTAYGKIYSKNASNTYVLNADYSWSKNTQSISNSGGQYVWNGKHVFKIGDKQYIGLAGSYAEQEELSSTYATNNPRFKSKTWEIENEDGTTTTLVIDATLLWTDGESVYYSNGANQYVLSGDYWVKKTWKYVADGKEFTFSFNGSGIWSDGGSIYYSYGESQYVLVGGAWIPKQWAGVESFYGSSIWSDGSNFYLDGGYVKQGNSWTPYAWSGLTPQANKVWTDGINIYHSVYQGDTYILGANYIYGITISPESEKLYSGDSCQFTATVNGVGTFDSSVRFSIESGTVTEATIDENTGLLEIGEPESGGSLVIKAESVLHPEICAYADVTVVAYSGSGPGWSGDDDYFPEPTEDLSPLYRMENGGWTKKTAYQWIGDTWMLISTADDYSQGGEPTGYYIYNGVKAPAPPRDYLAGYPYYCILTQESDGSIFMLMSPTHLYYNNGIVFTSGIVVMALWMPNQGTAWLYVLEEEMGSEPLPLDEGMAMIFSNHIIRNGSLDSTEVYMAAGRAQIEYA